jgi:nucleotide-binding universal stress UspA family protein
MKILIAYDGSSFADIAVDSLQSAGLPQHAEALIVTAVEPDRYATQSFGPVEAVSREWTKRIEEATHCAETISLRIQSYFPRWNVQLETPSGHAPDVILDRASTWPADLIVIGTHGRSGLVRAVLGSVSFKVVREAPCSVRVARASERRPAEPIRILIGNDGSPEAEAAVCAVCSRSWPAGAMARIIAVPQTLAPVDAPNFALAAQSLLASETFLKTDRAERHRLSVVIDESAKKLQDAGLDVSSVVEDGNPSQVLLQECRHWHPDTVFVGACGLGRVERLLLGSVSESLVTHAPCSVEVVRER